MFSHFLRHLCCIMQFHRVVSCDHDLGTRVSYGTDRPSMFRKINDVAISKYLDSLASVMSVV